MTRTVGLVVLIAAALLAWQSYSVWSMLQSCSIKAHAIIAAADPLDREPPDTLKSVVEQNIPLDELRPAGPLQLRRRHGPARHRVADRPTFAGVAPAHNVRQNRDNGAIRFDSRYG